MPPRNSSLTSFSSAGATEPCRLGFIGTGTIASAIVNGLATQTKTKIESIAVSRRSAAKSEALEDSFPLLVSVHDDNQALVDQSDIVFITVLPQQAKEVLQGIRFDPSRHILVSLVSTSKLPDLAADSGLPADSVYKMICLPAVATHDGVCLLTPPTSTSKNNHEILLALFESLGGVVEAENEREMSVMMVPSGLMGSFYGILQNNRDFLVRQGIPREKASFLVGRQYHAMMVDAEQRCSDPLAYEELIEEQTPGGLNEQGLANLRQLGVLEMYNKVQDAMLSRVLGSTDGSLDQAEQN